jgi:hypothetical protein
MGRSARVFPACCCSLASRWRRQLILPVAAPSLAPCTSAAAAKHERDRRRQLRTAAAGPAAGAEHPSAPRDRRLGACCWSALGSCAGAPHEDRLGKPSRRPCQDRDRERAAEFRASSCSRNRRARPGRPCRSTRRQRRGDPGRSGLGRSSGAYGAGRAPGTRAPDGHQEGYADAQGSRSSRSDGPQDPARPPLTAERAPYPANSESQRGNGSFRRRNGSGPGGHGDSAHGPQV